MNNKNISLVYNGKDFSVYEGEKLLFTSDEFIDAFLEFGRTVIKEEQKN